jgi:hypothetical protein
MPELGKKYTCYSCHTKFYDLGKPIPKCPKCGADQRDADEAPVVTTSRGRSRVVVEPEPIEDPELAESETPVAAGDEEEDEIVPTTDDREEEAEDEEEEEY